MKRINIIFTIGIFLLFLLLGCSRTSEKNEVSRFLATGDLHLGNRKNWEYGPKDLGERINNLDKKYPIDFVFEVGDVCLDFSYNVKDYDFEYMVEHSNVPFFHVMGDHEGWQWEKFTHRTATSPRSYYYLNDNILHIFINDPVSQWLAGTYTQGTRYFIKYLIEHKYPNKTTFLYSHYGVFGYSPLWDNTGDEQTAQKIGVTHTNKFANYQNTDWWDSLFKNNAQIKAFFNGHTHNNAYAETAWNKKNGVLFVDMEIYREDNNDFPLVTITKDSIHMVPYNLQREQFEPAPQKDEPGVRQEWTLKGPTSLDKQADDEFGTMRLLLDNREILNYNHVIGEQRQIEFVGLPSSNILPDPEFTNTRGYKGHPRVKGLAGTDASPFWIAGGGFDSTNVSQKVWNYKYTTLPKGSLDYTNVSQKGDTLIFTNAKGRISTHGLKGLPGVGTWQHFHGDYPPAAENIEFELTARIYSDSPYNNGLTGRVYFETDEWNRNFEKLPKDKEGNYTGLYTDVAVEDSVLDLSRGWHTYRITVRAPKEVNNPSADVPRLRALPEFKFNRRGNYKLDWVKLSPVSDDKEEEIVDPALNIHGQDFKTTNSLGSWESTSIDVPPRQPRELIKMSASGSKMGLVIFKVKNPRIKTWGRPVKWQDNKVIAGKNRLEISDCYGIPNDIYLKSLNGMFTVGKKWTSSVQYAPKLYMEDIDKTTELESWNISASSDGEVKIKELRTDEEPFTISWDIQSTDKVTWKVGDLESGVKYTILEGSNVLQENIADRRGFINFTVSAVDSLKIMKSKNR